MAQLTDIETRIRDAAIAKGIDPTLAISIARNESRLDPLRKNEKSTASGLYGITNDTWKRYGGVSGKQFDVDENIRVGLNIIQDSQNELGKRLGRPVTSSDTYTAHILGWPAATAVLKADQERPVQDVIRQFYGKKYKTFANRVVTSNPELLGGQQTVGGFTAVIDGKMAVPAAAPALASALPTEDRAGVSNQQFIDAKAAARKVRTGPFGPKSAETATPVAAEATPPVAPAALNGLNPSHVVGIEKIGPNFQAALALSMMSDGDKDGESADAVEAERERVAEEAESQKPSRAAQALASLRNLPGPNAFGSAQPVTMAKGGDASLAAADDLEEEPYIASHQGIPAGYDSPTADPLPLLRLPRKGDGGGSPTLPSSGKEPAKKKSGSKSALALEQYKVGLRSAAITDAMQGLGSSQSALGSPTFTARGAITAPSLNVAHFDKGGSASEMWDAVKDFSKDVARNMTPLDLATMALKVKNMIPAGMATYSGELNADDPLEEKWAKERVHREAGSPETGETGAAYGNPAMLAAGEKIRARKAVEASDRSAQQAKADVLSRASMRRFDPETFAGTSDTPSGPRTLDEAAGLDPKVTDRTAIIPNWSKKDGLTNSQAGADLAKLMAASDPRNSHLMQPEEAMPLASTVMGGGMGASMATTAVGPGTLGMFLGKAGKTYNPAAEALLLKLEKEGVSPQEIYRITQEKFGHPYGRSPLDQQIKYEISDQNAFFKPLANERTVQPDKYGRSSLNAGAPFSRIEELYHHPELKAAHPDLMKKTFLGLENTPDASGAAMFNTYNVDTVPTAVDKFVGMLTRTRPGFKRGQKIHVSGPDDATRKEVLTHELNHFSQNLNKGSEGGSSLDLAREAYPDLMHAGMEKLLKPIDFMDFAKDLKKQKPDQAKNMSVADMVKQYQEEHVKPSNDNLAEYRKLHKQGYFGNESSNNIIYRADEQVAAGIYNRISGEAESRLAANRSNLSPKQLGENYPYEPNYFKTGTGEDLKDILRGPVTRAGGSPEEGERSVGDRLTGYGETAASLLSGLGASIPAGYSGLMELARTRDPEMAAQEISRRQAAMTYEPRTTAGKESTKSAAELLENLNVPAQKVGDVAFDVSGNSPVAGAAAQTLLDPLNFIPGAKSLGKLGKKGIQKAIENASVPKDPFFTGSGGSQRGAIKLKGGNWLENNVERTLGSLKPNRYASQDKAIKEAELADLLEQEAQTPGRHPRRISAIQNALVETDRELAFNQWIDKQLTRYVKNEMATPEDPVRALAEKGVLHFEPQNLRDHTGHRSSKIDAERKEFAGENKGRWGYGENPLAQKWEDASDLAIKGAPYRMHLGAVTPETAASALRNLGGEFAVQNPNAKAYSFNSPSGIAPFGVNISGLGFDHLTDELRNAINPASGLPRELLIKPESLSRLSVPQAVERVAKINEWRAEQISKARLDNMLNADVYKEYPEKGMRWVELNKPGQFVEESNAMGHSVRGYEPSEQGGSRDYGLGGWPAIQSGKAKIYSLRDARGEPHVTIEVQPAYQRELTIGDMGSMAPEKQTQITAMHKARQPLPKIDVPGSIHQIKGKSNLSPAEQYMEFVDDFVKSQPWGRVMDLHNTNLVKIDQGSDIAKMLESKGLPVPSYVTQNELTALLKTHAPLGSLKPVARAGGSPEEGERSVGDRLTDELSAFKEKGAVSAAKPLDIFDPVNAVTTAAGKYSSYQDLLKFLGSNKPPIRFTPLGEGTLGEYAYGKRYGNTGEVRINSNALRYMRDAPAETARTLIHETTHATDRQLDNLYFKYKDDPPTPEITQFVKGYKKLRWNATRPNAPWQSPPSEALARQLDPEWARKNAPYRAHAGELYAHAVGNTARTSDDQHSQRYRSIDIPLHLDPSLATENFILLDLANRAQKSLQTK